LRWLADLLQLQTLGSESLCLFKTSAVMLPGSKGKVAPKTYPVLIWRMEEWRYSSTHSYLWGVKLATHLHLVPRLRML
jgi:hypothetical protein